MIELLSIQGSAGKQIRYLIGTYAHNVEPGDGKIRRKKEKYCKHIAHSVIFSAF